MAFKNKKEAQEAYDQLSRSKLATHFALVASMNGTLEKVGSVQDGSDSYTWHLAFSPRLEDPIIVEVFQSKMNVSDTIRAFYFEDWKFPFENKNPHWDAIFAQTKMIVNRRRENTKLPTY